MMDLEFSRLMTMYLPAYLAGTKATLTLSLGAGALGIPLGIALGLASSQHRWTLGFLIQFASFILCHVPLVVVLLWAHYPLQELADTSVSPKTLAFVLLTLLATLLNAVCVQRELRSLPKRYEIAAQVCGVCPHNFRRAVQLPLLTARLAPWFLISQVVVLHSSVMTSMISVEELFRTAQRVTMATYRPIEAYTIAGLIFLLICLPLNLLAARMRRVAASKGLLER